jgi:hypothetical protein
VALSPIESGPRRAHACQRPYPNHRRAARTSASCADNTIAITAIVPWRIVVTRSNEVALIPRAEPALSCTLKTRSPVDTSHAPREEQADTDVHDFGGGEWFGGHGAAVRGNDAVSAVVQPGRLRHEMTRRGWNASDLARESRLSQATVSAALAGKAIATTSLALIAAALSRVPPVDVIDSLILSDRSGAYLE